MEVVTYFGYVEVNLHIPGVQAFSEDVFMPDVEDSDYDHKVLIQIETFIYIEEKQD